MNTEQLKSMNEMIKTTPIKGKDYAMVHERIKALRAFLPAAAITTEIVHVGDGEIIIKATVYDEDGKILGTGHAEERQGNGNINQTSYVENCETSAVGRALGMCAIGIDKSFASADEVANAILQSKGKDKIGKKEAELFRIICKKHGKTPTEGYEEMTVNMYLKAMKALIEEEPERRDVQG